MAKTRRFGLLILGALCGALLGALPCGSAVAGPDGQPVTGSLPPAKPSTTYFVDFRSRPGYLFGHTFIVYGRLDDKGRPIESHYAGSYPLDGQRGLIIGSFIPVPSSVRGVKEDYKEHATNIYRRRLSPAQFERLKRVVHRLRKNNRSWNLLFANCNDFAIEVAHGLGMATPVSWLLPDAFVDQLRSMNGH